uniref:Uncharacterized protein n=1 Tax=Knipowitschia caucasica TaxID=637954 RepID=A0AAV2MIW0_KNICA
MQRIQSEKSILDEPDSPLESRILYHSNLPVIPYYPPRYSDTLGTGTLPHVYNYDTCRTTDSRKSDCKFGRAGSQNVLIMDPSSTGTMQRIQSEKSILDEPDSPLESRILYHSNLPVIPYYPPRYSDTLGTGTLPHVYNYDTCRTTDSRKSDCKFGRAGSQNVLIMDPSSTGTMQRIQSEKSILDEPDSPLESRILYHSNLPVIPYYPPRYSDTLGTGTLPHVYNYDTCRTTDSRKSDCKFGRAGSQNVLIMDPSSTGTMQRIQSEKSILDEPDSPLETLCVDMSATLYLKSWPLVPWSAILCLTWAWMRRD